jgi:hypothetical protein
MQLVVVGFMKIAKVKGTLRSCRVTSRKLREFSVYSFLLNMGCIALQACGTLSVSVDVLSWTIRMLSN